MGTVPLLLIELILVMKLPKEETVALGWKLGLASAIMVALGYPGEIQDDLSVRWTWWALAMVPFSYVVVTNSSGTRSQTLSPRQCLASSFGLLRRGSPRKRRTMHCFLSELGEHLFSLSLYYFPCTSDHAAVVRQQHGCIGFGGSFHRHGSRLHKPLTSAHSQPK